MASFEPTTDSAATRSESVKYPFRRIEPTIHKLVKVLQIDLDRLRRHLINITTFESRCERDSAERERVNATRTAQQLAANMRQLERIRASVCDGHLPQFDERVAGIRSVAADAIAGFLQTDSANDDNGEQQLCDGDDGVGFDGRLAWSETNSLRHRSTSEGHWKPADSVEQQQSQQQIQQQKQQQLSELQVVRNSEQTSQSWEELMQSLEELNALMHQYSTLVHSQKEMVNHIQDNMEMSHANVVGGTTDVCKAAKYKSVMIPLAGALLGGTVGGPIGLVAGAKLGGLASLGGGILGFAGGSYWKKQHNKTISSDMEKIKNRGYESCPD